MYQMVHSGAVSGADARQRLLDRAIEHVAEHGIGDQSLRAMAAALGQRGRHTEPLTEGTTGVWDDDHLFFVDVRSPRTAANIRRGSQVEVNVVDQFVRKGYRFRGPAVVHEREAEGVLRRVRAGAGGGHHHDS